MTSVAEKLAKKAARPISTKQVRLKLVYLDFWSVVKLAFLISLALGIVLVVASFLIWLVLAQTGIFGNLNTLLQDISGPGFDIFAIVSLPQVLGFSFLLAVLGVVVGTALGAIAAVLYNLSVRMTGGILVGFTNE